MRSQCVNVSFIFFRENRYSALIINRIPQMIYVTTAVPLTLLNLRWKMRRSKVGRTWQVGEFIGRCCPLLQTGSSSPGVARQESSAVARPADAHGKRVRQQLRRLGIFSTRRLQSFQAHTELHLFNTGRIASRRHILESTITASVQRILNGKC